LGKLDNKRDLNVILTVKICCMCSCALVRLCTCSAAQCTFLLRYNSKY